MALPLALAGQDVIGQARTGTGKTYAFGVAMLQLVGKPRKNRKKPRGLVLVPTRELALQVTEDLVLAAGKLGSRILTVYGGRAYEPQIEALKNGVDVIVGTPGRLLDLVKQKHLDLSQVGMLVLDEADRMLDLGFLPDIERIIKLVPEKRQTMLFSATMPGEIVALSRRYLTRPTNVRAENNEAEAEATPQTTQFVYRTHRMDKIEILARLLQSTGSGLTMVFCETKRACDMVSEQLREKGFAAAAVHGDLGQGQREQALRAFRNGKINVLVATDVAARGIDIDDVTHVVNYDCPQDEKTYVHRIGRTGRAGRTGVAVTFVEWTELTRWKVINNALGLDFADPVETYSSSPHVYTDLGIPEGTKGVLPRANRSRAGLDAEEIEDLGETGRARSRKSDRAERGSRGDREERRERPARTRERRRTRGGRTQEAVTSDAPAGSGTADTSPVSTATASTLGDILGDILDETPPTVETTTGRRSRRGANSAALSGALADITPAQPQDDGAAPALPQAEPVAEPISGPVTGPISGPISTPVSTPVNGPAAETVVEKKPARRRTRAVAAPAPETSPEATEQPAVQPAGPAEPVPSGQDEQVAAARPARRRARAAAVDAPETGTPRADAPQAGAARRGRALLDDAPVETPVMKAPVRVPVEAPVEVPVDVRAQAVEAVVETPQPRPEPERIIPASPFVVVFQSPDLATEDDDPAPSAATERAQQRRRPGPRPRPRRTG
ncbi:DEAD/DEAH box helicase [Planotetraspora sp. A-T 1434]|uniref:DEAD/DEAH box helicase n=1 Tax=Planotetraspora sp. A-T 1434 TaxID=2979219 RepID=UPI0039658D8E